jgi:hypothetical protein
MKTYFNDKLKNRLLVNYSESSGSIRIPVNRGRFILWIKITFLFIVTVSVVIYKINSNLVNSNKMLESKIELTETLLKNLEDQVSTLNGVKDRIGSLEIDNEFDNQLEITLTKSESGNENKRQAQKTGGK